ncbi:MAG: hypothetical protein HZB59_00810 [Ignavibacteriales bacterium]|nr:hypothetical protein [Ignavibacteriales bacterium]
MGFKKIEDFIGVELDPDARVMFVEWEKYLNKIVYFGGEIFCEILNKSTLGKDDSLPLIMFFRNSIELVGAISSLNVNFYSEPAKIILRTLLETMLYINYISQKDSKQRALSFLICQYHEKLNAYKKLDPTKEQGKRFHEQLKDDEFFKTYKFQEQDLLKLQIENLESLIKNDLYKEVEKEYQRVKKENPRHKPVWHEFFGGPKTIEKLAYNLKVGSLYEIIYRNLSKGTHGNNIIDGYISDGGEGITHFSQIRFPYSAQFVCQITITLSLRIYRIIIVNQVPEMMDKYKSFYLSEIRDFHLAMANQEFLKIK